MAKKVKFKKSPRKGGHRLTRDAVEESMDATYQGEMVKFVQFFEATEEKRDKLKNLRNTYLPMDDEEYFSSLDLDTDIFDTTPINSMHRMTAGFLSYHLSPTEEFFSPKSLTLANVDEEGVRIPNDFKKLEQRKEELHNLVQQRDNLIVYAKNYRDKAVFGYTAKTIDPDPYMTVRFTHYPPEDVCRVSSNGKVNDIFCIREKLTLFQARQRFRGVKIKEGVISGLFDGLVPNEGDYYYRINMPRRVLYEHLQSTLQLDEDMYLDDYIRTLLKLGRTTKLENDHEWVDFWFNDNQLLSLEVKNHISIVISQLLPSNYNLGFGKGLGEMNFTTHKLLTQLEIINLNAYEATYDPAWAIPDEASKFDVTLGRREYIIYEEENMIPKHLSLGSNFQQAVEFKNYIQARYDRNLFLDAFELLNKSRMTEFEVEIRNDNFRLLGIFVIQDQSDELNPTMNSVNAIGSSYFKDPAYMRGEQTNMVFTSPLAVSHKKSILDMTSRVLAILKEMITIGEADSSLNDRLDLKKNAVKMLGMIGYQSMLKSKEGAKKAEDDRERKQELELEAIRGKALEQTGRAIQASTPPNEAGGEAGGGTESVPAEIA